MFHEKNITPSADFPDPAYFQKIMADGVVTSDELREQTSRVINLLHEVENRFSEEDQLLVKRLFAETNVLSVIYHQYSLQNIR